MSLGRRKRFLVTFVRHGETELNRQKIIQGQGKDEPLNERGRRQATALGKWLSEETYTHVYSSDLKRAHETCENIMKENWSLKEAGTAAEIRFEQRIRERFYGEMEGRKKQECVFTQAMLDSAESIEDLGNRADEFFMDLCKTCFEYSGDRKILADSMIDAFESKVPSVLVVSHGRLLATLYARFSEKYGCTFPSYQKLGVVSPNTGRSCFTVEFMKGFSPSENVSPNGRRKIILNCTTLHNSDHLENV